MVTDFTDFADLSLRYLRVRLSIFAGGGQRCPTYGFLVVGQGCPTYGFAEG